MIINSLFIYPIKSLSGVSVSKIQVTHSGIQGDREFMLLDENNIFITQRQITQLSLIKTEINNLDLILSYQNSSYKIKKEFGELIQTKIWNDPVTVCEADSKASEFISDCVKRKLKLVCFSAQHPRVRKSKDGQNFEVKFVDGSQAHLCNLKSLGQLNSELKSPVTISRFRPNIVFEGSAAWQEDEFKKIKIGECQFKFNRHTTRCKIITIDPSKGNVSSDEPLVKLKEIKNKKTAEFGIDLVSEKVGNIFVGDTLTEII